MAFRRGEGARPGRRQRASSKVRGTRLLGSTGYPGGRARQPAATRDVVPASVIPSEPGARPVTSALPGSLRVLAAVAWRWIVVVAGAFILLYLIRRLWMPFLALSGALFLTALLEPLNRGLVRLRVPRALAALLSLLAAICVFAGVGYFVETRFAGSVSALGTDLRSAFTSFNDWLHTGPLHLSNHQLTGYENRLLNTVKQHRSSLASIGVAGLSSAFEIVSGSLIALFTGFFLLYEGDRIWAWLRRLFPRSAGPYVAAGGDAAWHALTGYVRGTVVVAAIDATCIWVGLFLLGVPLAVPLAVIIFLGAFVPLVGAISTGVIAILVALVAKGWVAAVITVGLLVVVELLEGHFLQPLIIGRSVHIHPVAIIFAVTIGTILAGVGGAVLAVPAVAVLSSAIGSVYHLRAERRSGNQTDRQPAVDGTQLQSGGVRAGSA